MPIIQISKIQQRSGNLVDLPQLDEAQFGFATDAKRVFIGKTTGNTENIEVLTSYCVISFSQILGADGGNFNINSAQNGQILTYVASTNTWENWPSTDIITANSSFKLDLGDIAHIKMTGNASTGFVLQTDGLGNLSWAPKGTVVSDIANVSQASPGVITTAANHYLVDKAQVTITGIVATGSGNNITKLNGGSFYANVITSNTFSLYEDMGFTVPVSTLTGGGNTQAYSNGGQIVSTLGGTVSTPGGSGNTIQFNNGGYLDGSPYFTITSTGNLTHSGSWFTVTGNLTSGNITTGGLLTVTGNATVGNINTSGLITATGNIRGGNLVTAGVVSATGNGTFGNVTATLHVGNLSGTGNSNVGNLGVTGLVTVTGNITGGNIVTSGTVSASGNASVLGIKTDNYYYANGVAVNFNGTYSNANVASYLPTYTGTLSGGNLSVTGNSNVGNLGTAGLITATGNITAGNLVTGGVVSATGNGTFGNVTATLHVGNLSGTGNSNVGNLGASGLITATGNIIGGNIITAGVVSATGNGTFGNVTATLHVGNLSGTGNSNVGNLGVSGLLTATGNVTAGNLVTSGVVSASGNATVLGIKTDNYYYANGVSISFAGSYSNSNVASYLPTYTGNLAGGNLNLSNNAVITVGANTNVGTIVGNWSLSAGSRLQATYADLAEYYQADTMYEPGTVLEFGGPFEVTIAEDGSTRVAGVVTTEPAYVMNTGCSGNAVAIALQGRVPVKVRGIIRKGDMLISAGNGYARPCMAPQVGTVIGKALQDYSGNDGIIEVAVGRL